MADVSSIRTSAPQLTTGASAPPPPQAPPQPQAPPAASDRVTLNSGEAPGYSYKHEQDSSGVQYQTWSARSGVKYEVATKDQETRFHVEVPKGVSPAPLEISGAAAPGQPVQLVAHEAGNPNNAIPVQMADGKYLINMGASGAVAMFDPNTLDFGIASPPQAQMAPNGQPAMYQALQEVVHADSSHTVKAHAFITEGMQGGGNMMGFGMGTPTPVREARYLQIDESANGQVTAKQVVERETPQGAQGMLGQMVGGPARQETAVGVTRQADGSYAVAGGASLMSHMKASLQNPFALQSPLMSWMKGRKEQATVVQTFSSNPALLATMGAAAGPAAAMAMQTPFGMPGAVPPPPGFPR